MIIDFLAVCDYRVFSGVHRIDLAPRVRRGRARPIILFGGLNGAGKTSILTALKLALYGKGSLGVVSAADYHSYLKSSIHRRGAGASNPSYSFVELGFQHAQHGVKSQYRVKRDWKIETSGKVKEGLHIYRDEQLLAELSYDQAQAFLNELIPIGVSELFFFDGEKIKALAEETTGEALRSSIEKLLGLDVVSRLDSDLSVLVRTRATKGLLDEKRKRIAALEREFTSLKLAIEADIDEFQVYRASHLEHIKNIEQIQKDIDARGGAWSSSRQEESARLTVLAERRSAAESQLRDLAGSLLPLAIARDGLKRAVSVLSREREARSYAGLTALITKKRTEFMRALAGVSDVEAAMAAYDTVFSSVASSKQLMLLHDLSDGQIASFEHRVERVIPAESKRAAMLAQEIEDFGEEIDMVALNLSRAPDEDVLKPLYQRLNDESGCEGAARARLEGRLEKLRQDSIRLSDVARQLDSNYADVASSNENDRVYGYAVKTRELLKEFSLRTTQRKLAELEIKFVESYRRLARKKDVELFIRIDPASFEVNLYDASGSAVNKNELSAGEKQIYAISILEALGSTSGRNLPVIIDTPLGRLDSHHRKNLVDNYFPVASHQVIILSTDTEVDRSFYMDLAPSISHAYHLSFDPTTRSTTEEEGYFWRSEEVA